MKKIKNIIFTLVILLLSLSIIGCSKEDVSDDNANKGKTALETIKEKDKIRIGVFSDKPPFGYIDSLGKNQGFDVYIAKRFAKDLLGDENKVEFVLVEAASRVEYLETNKVDIILANFTVTDERKEIVDFGNPYMKVALGVVSSKENPIKHIDDLKGKKLIVNKGTTAETYFTNNYPEIELLKYDQNSEAFQALKDGRGAALAHDNTLLFAWVKENTEFVTGITSLGDQDTIAPAVKKGNTELLNWINQELDALTTAGFMEEAYNATLVPAYGDTIKPEDIIFTIK